MHEDFVMDSSVDN